MGKAENHSTDQRLEALLLWLKNQEKLTVTFCEPLVRDASFRRYFRIHTPEGPYVVMDAPPEKEACQDFVTFSKRYEAENLQVPHIYGAEEAKGFLRLTDFGHRSLKNEFTLETAQKWIPKAQDCLVTLQSSEILKGLPKKCFGREAITAELEAYVEWFIRGFLHLTLTKSEIELLQAVFESILQVAEAQPQVVAHRDYHSANIMVLPDETLGLLDFQDTLWGPITYDFASFCVDRCPPWPEERLAAWVHTYYQKLLGQQLLPPTISADTFFRWFRWMALQRLLKIQFIFARKALRDHNAAYLPFLPMALQQTLAFSQGDETLEAFHQFLNRQVQPLHEQLPSQ